MDAVFAQRPHIAVGGNVEMTRMAKVRHLRSLQVARRAPEVKVVKAQPVFEVDFRSEGESWARRVAYGQSLRKATRRESHGAWMPAKNRPDPVEIVLASDAGRQEHLLPLRHARMAASPFGFLRGAAAVMASDLSRTPTIGLPVVICGDAHLNNFGLYGTPQRDIVMDINDFDEVSIGPWEWDLKRLTASVNVLGRENGLDADERRHAVMVCVAGYRTNLRRFESMSVLDLWYLHAIADHIDITLIKAAYPAIVKAWPKADAILRKAVAKARKTDNAMLLRKIADRSVDGGWRFRADPPVLTPVGARTREQVIDALNSYWHSLPSERRWMLRRYHVVDVAHRVVGVGSVGNRAYLAMLFGNSDADALFLQVKEAVAPVHAPYLPAQPTEYQHNGRRVTIGQTVMQASHDPLLGYAEMDGRQYYVRQMKNMKGALPMSFLSGDPFAFFSFAFGCLLARAHSRSGDGAVIAGYCGKSSVLDDAYADWAEAYGDQTVKDHGRLVNAIKAGRIEAAPEL
jgi:uncharacterized protein (DUF2252 family)